MHSCAADVHTKTGFTVKLLLFGLITCWCHLHCCRMSDEFEEHSTRALRNPEKHMSNPVNAFLAVKRFTSDWDNVVQTYIRNNVTEGKLLS